MLVLNRSVSEQIVINGNIVVTICKVRGDNVKVGVDAPRGVTVHRKEVQNEIDKRELSARRATTVVST